MKEKVEYKMCLMIEEVVRFNTWDAFNRMCRRVIANYGDKRIHGQIYLPAHYTFKNWKEFKVALKGIKELGKEISDNVREASSCLKAGYPHSNKNDALPSIYGEIHVEITDPWIDRW